MTGEEGESVVFYNNKVVSPELLLEEDDFEAMDEDMYNINELLPHSMLSQSMNESLSSVYSTLSVDVIGDVEEIPSGVEEGEEEEQWEEEHEQPCQPPPSPHISNDYVNFNNHTEIMEIPARTEGEHLDANNDENEQYSDIYDETMHNNNDNNDTNNNMQLDDDLLVSVMMDQYEEKLASQKLEFDQRLLERQAELDDDFQLKLQTRKNEQQEKFKLHIQGIKVHIDKQQQETELDLKKKSEVLREREAHQNTLEQQLSHQERVLEKREQSQATYDEQLTTRERIQATREEQQLQKQQDISTVESGITNEKLTITQQYKKINTFQQELSIRVETLKERLDRVRVCETLCSEREVAQEAQDVQIKKKQEEGKKMEDRVKSQQLALKEQEKMLEKRTERLAVAWEDAKKAFSSKLQHSNNK